MNSKTILLIEDNPSDVELTKRALTQSRIANDLVVAEDGKEAIDYLWGGGAHADRNISDLPTLTLTRLRYWRTGI